MFPGVFPCVPCGPRVWGVSDAFTCQDHPGPKDLVVSITLSVLAFSGRFFLASLETVLMSKRSLVRSDCQIVGPEGLFEV